MDVAYGLTSTQSGRLQVPHGKSTRFQVKKLYDRLQHEVISNIDRGNPEIAVRLINSRGNEVNHQDENGVTLLMSVASRGTTSVAKALLEEGAGIDSSDNDSWTPLMYAARDGHADVARELLDAGADLEHRDVGGWTPIMWSCYKGQLACVKLMIERGANVNIKALYNMTCLHWAAGRGHDTIVDVLLKTGAKVNATDKYGSTPLIWAARKGYLDIVEMLLTYSAITDTVGMYSWTPLLVALQGGHANVANALLETNPNLNSTDKDGMTALSLAAKAGYVDIVQQAIDQGAYLNVMDKNGDTVLHHAVKGGHTEIVKLLLRKNPDIDARGQENKTVLYLAVDKGNSIVVKMILAKDPDKELADRDGNTPLLRAVRNRNTEMAHILVEKGARVAAADSKGDISLHIAMRTRNRRMLEVLLKNPKHSRYLYVRNHAGETAYSIDNSKRKSLLTQIFGAKSLNSQIAVESQLGYELYSSALADILSSPSLNTPMTVGLFAKWGSGKSFMLNKLKEDMKAYMRHSLPVYFEFSWLVFIINFTISALIGLIIGLASKYYIGLAVGFAMLILFYTIQGTIYCIFERRGWEWVTYISHALAKKLQAIRLLVYLLFYNRPSCPNQELHVNSISFVFAESTRLTSLGGEQSLASMIGSLCDALEKKYGTCVTRLYKIFGSEKEHKGRYKKICCIPYFIVVLFVVVCLLTLIGMLTVHHEVVTSRDTMLERPEISIPMLVLAIIITLALLSSLHNIGLAIAAYANSPKRRAMRASQSLDVHKSDNFLHLIKEEVEYLSSLVTTMDRHEQWQTRLVLIIDGLDSCEQEKVLQVLDAINLIIPDNSPFIILLALDPHVIIKGIEANQLKGANDPSLNGYGYLRNMVHLPFYLQNHGLPSMLTNTDQTRQRWRATAGLGKSRMSTERQASAVSSTMSLADSQAHRKGRRASLPADSSLITLEPMQQFIGEMPKNIVKNDYFVDINPRSMRRLMNIIAMAGRLLRANDIEYNWHRLSAWINITEQWPCRLSWILLYYEEMEGKLDDNLSLLSIYDLVKERMSLVRDAESLLEIDRNEKKFIAFLKSHVPKLGVEDIKRFMPSTINLDPYLRKIIKERTRDHEMMLQERGFIPPPTIPTAANGTEARAVCSRIPTSPTHAQYPLMYNQLYGGNMMGGTQYRNAQCGGNTWTAAPGHLQITPATQSQRLHKIPKAIEKPLSRHSVVDISELLSKIPGISSLNIDTYRAALLLHNITGTVLADCDLNELRSVLEMKFGDWQLFKNTILAMREVDFLTPASSNGELANSKTNLNINTNHIEARAGTMSPSVNGSKASSLASSPSLKTKGSWSVETVTLENQMIADALDSQLVSASDDDDTGSDTDELDDDLSNQGTVRHMPALTSQLSESAFPDKESDEVQSVKSVKFSVLDETTGGTRSVSESSPAHDSQPLIESDMGVEMSTLNSEARTLELKKANVVTSLGAVSALPVIMETDTLRNGGADEESQGFDNPAFSPAEDGMCNEDV